MGRQVVCEGTVNRSTHFLFVNNKYRLLTPIEAERLQDFPDDWTYTLPIEEMSKILGTNLTFDKLVFSGSFVYADGHLCLNHPDYVINFNGRWWLTEKAKKNMAECCLPFRRVYGKENYRYTFGELNESTGSQP